MSSLSCYQIWGWNHSQLVDRKSKICIMNAPACNPFHDLISVGKYKEVMSRIPFGIVVIQQIQCTTLGLSLQKTCITNIWIFCHERRESNTFRSVITEGRHHTTLDLLSWKAHIQHLWVCRDERHLSNTPLFVVIQRTGARMKCAIQAKLCASICSDSTGEEIEKGAYLRIRVDWFEDSGKKRR